MSWHFAFGFSKKRLGCQLVFLWRFYGGPVHYGLSPRLLAGVIVIVSPIQTDGYLVAAGV